MHYLCLLMLLNTAIFTVISCKITQKCDYKINEDSFPISRDVLTGSPTILKKLAENEEIIHALVQQYYFNRQNLTNCQRYLMQQYLLHFDSSTGTLTHRYKLPGEQVSSRAHNVAWNPIATFLMVRRFRSFLLPLVASLNGTSHKGLFSKVTSAMKTTAWPWVTNLNASIDVVLRIQQVHDLSTPDDTQGKLDDDSTGLSISPDESVIIAERATYDGKYALAIEWFEQAHNGFSVNHSERESVAKNLENAIIMTTQQSRSSSWKFLGVCDCLQLVLRRISLQGRVTASPVKGSAVFWFNLMKSADVDQSSWHGACPVIIGKKWIANKWIRYADQVLLKPGCKCDVDPESKFSLNDLSGDSGRARQAIIIEKSIHR